LCRGIGWILFDEFPAHSEIQHKPPQAVHGVGGVADAVEMFEQSCGVHRDTSVGSPCRVPSRESSRLWLPATVTPRGVARAN
jgi:hypothetical protein